MKVTELKVSDALAGNRTRASRVAGKNSTTEPPMLDTLDTCLQTPTSGHTLRSAVLLLDHMFALHSVGLPRKLNTLMFSIRINSISFRTLFLLRA